jgi:hypothetical protein
MAGLSQCKVPPISLARPGFACRLPGHPPLPGFGEEGRPSKCGGRGGDSLLHSSHLKGFTRCHPSSGADLFRITSQLLPNRPNPLVSRLSYRHN